MQDSFTWRSQSARHNGGGEHQHCGSTDKMTARGFRAALIACPLGRTTRACQVGLSAVRLRLPARVAAPHTFLALDS